MWLENMRHAGKINELSCAPLQVIGCFGLFEVKTLVSCAD